MTRISTLLLEHLYDLTGDDLDRFKWFLKTGVAQGFAPIPQGKLENTKREAVVDLMMSAYDSDAGTVALQILRRMQQNNLATQLEKKLQEVQDQASRADQVDGAASGSAQAPGARGVQQNIQADNSSNVTAPVISGGTYHGPVNLTFK
ncbi:hypothetical protein NFI96_020593 [Prochilodus magdalenae]|nr:hypothetical protein NFI96_020593 [Prochilodus magdalenae]